MTHTQINKLYFLDHSVFYVWTVKASSAFVDHLFVAQFGTLFWTRPPSVCSCQRAQALLSIHLDFEDKHGDKECVQDALKKPWMIASVSPIWALPSPHQRRHSVTLPTPLHIPTCWLSQSSLAYFPPRYQFWQKVLRYLFLVWSKCHHAICHRAAWHNSLREAVKKCYLLGIFPK